MRYLKATLAGIGVMILALIVATVFSTRGYVGPHQAIGPGLLLSKTLQSPLWWLVGLLGFAAGFVTVSRLSRSHEGR